MSEHHLSNADVLAFGKVLYLPARGKRGIALSPLVFVDLGAPANADADGLINDATGAELPNDGTKTYTFPAENASPTDEALRSGELDVPRNIVAAATAGETVVAMTITITGVDCYGARMVEALSIAGGAPPQSATGKKAFAAVTQIDITSASDATGNTLNIGTGNVLGLPFRADANCVLSPRTANAADSGTFVPADTATPTATTGDVRGTYTPSGTLNGTNKVGLLIALNAPSSKTAIYGLSQYAG